MREREEAEESSRSWCDKEFMTPSCVLEDEELDHGRGNGLMWERLGTPESRTSCPLFLLPGSSPPPSTVLGQRTLVGDTLVTGAVFGSDAATFRLGAIVDSSTPIGKQEAIAMQMAIDDFYKNSSNKPLLHIRSTGGSPSQAAFAGVDLIEKKKVQAIVGMRSFDEAAFVGEFGTKNQIPILSFVGTAPSGAFKRWPFLVRAIQPKHEQMNTIAAIIGTWQWRKVNLLYEGISSATANIIPPLVNALQQVNCEIENLVPLPLDQQPTLLTLQLEQLRKSQCRVFIVHSSWSVAAHLFREAKKMGMMEEGSVWITTSVITDLLEYYGNSSDISSMQGVLGIKSYFSQSTNRFRNFSLRFRRKFRVEYPKEKRSHPGIYSLQAYDAVWSVTHALETGRKVNTAASYGGKELLERILGGSFEGLAGKFQFTKSDELTPAETFQLINVVGKSYRELGFWSKNSGFSRVIGGPLLTPRGWALPNSNDPLKIGVPRSAFPQFVDIIYSDFNKSEPKLVTGFAIDVFKEVFAKLPYKFSYHFIPYNGSYDSLVAQVSSKTFDMVVGDTSILAQRCDHAEFSQPWSDSGIRMVMYKKKVNNNVWLVVKPFTKRLWLTTAGINVFNGFAVWWIEHKSNPELAGGSFWDRIGTLAWLIFSTIFSRDGHKIQSNLSRMILVGWIIVAIVLMQSYVANLTTWLTLSNLNPNVHISDMKNKVVGCDTGSFIYNYLVDVLHFSPKNVKTISSHEEYPLALKSGEIAAAFLSVPHVKLFLSKYCKDFVSTEPIYNFGGFGFGFPRRSPMLPDFSKVILELIENGRIQELENEMLRFNNCSGIIDSKFNNEETSLDLTSFTAIFILSVGISLVCLIIFLIRSMWPRIRRPLVSNEHHPENDEFFMFASELSKTR
ncbi:hypothetical protein Sjap_025861 [Stephania japonica]|uniref:Glutamate receptor n=1 Tax=Stephania japonica TaxID=461633 RepID=A0AAP0E2E6_9MAGN